MKKTVALILLVMSALLLWGCNGGSTDSPKDQAPATTTQKPNDDPATTTKPNEDPDPAVTAYTITWVDENGVTLASGKVDKNTVPSYSYTVTDTAEWDYTFLGWATSANGEVLSAIPPATEDATYYARVSAEKQTYTVTFNANGGTPVASQTVAYGEKATLPEAPRYESHKFVCWCYDASGTTPVDFDQPITQDVEYFATWNEVVNVKELLLALLNGYKLDPLGYIPESMRYDYSANLVDGNALNGDFSQFVNVANISYGHGEQWHMVLDNLLQSQTFFNVLSVVDTVSAASITAFNNYFDKNPSDTAHHKMQESIYNITVDFDGEVLFYVLDYTATLPALGEQTVQIALSLNVETSEKAVRIQIGDANALTYRINENSYEFAIKYLGVRRAMFSIEKDADGNVSGKIFEYIVVSAVEIASAAEFYITEDYVSVIGNKADGMIGFKGYIAELYNAKNGKMIAYEVKETLSAVNYDTLWFNLDDIAGINSIKYVPAGENTPAAIYINGSSEAWTAKKALLSRRFDIEFRTQYVYSYDPATEEYIVYTVSVPMLFVQKKYYDSLVSDIKSTNGVTVSVQVQDTDLNKLLDDYDTLIPIFIEHKDQITPDIIIAYIGEKITFEEGN